MRMSWCCMGSVAAWGMSIVLVMSCCAIVGLGAAFLSTDGPWATLHLHARLPETLILVIPGRPLASLVDHPMFRDAGYRVEAAWQPPMRGGAVIRFRPGLIR